MRVTSNTEPGLSPKPLSAQHAERIALAAQAHASPCTLPCAWPLTSGGALTATHSSGVMPNVAPSFTPGRHPEPSPAHLSPGLLHGLLSDLPASPSLSIVTGDRVSRGQGSLSALNPPVAPQRARTQSSSDKARKARRSWPSAALPSGPPRARTHPLHGRQAGLSPSLEHSR